MFSISTGLAPQTTMIIWDFQFLYSALGWASPDCIMQTFIYGGVSHFRATWRNSLIFGTIFKGTNFSHIIHPLVSGYFWEPCGRIFTCFSFAWLITSKGTSTKEWYPVFSFSFGITLLFMTYKCSLEFILKNWISRLKKGAPSFNEPWASLLVP